MMKSVALAESCYSHMYSNDDTDYVVVSVPPTCLSTMNTIEMTAMAFNEGNDEYDDCVGETEGKDSDDASYDYCNDFVSSFNTNVATNIPIAVDVEATSPMMLLSVPTEVPFETDLSLVVDDDDDDDDDGSECYPLIASDDTVRGIDQWVEPVDNISDVSTTSIVQNGNSTEADFRSATVDNAIHQSSTFDEDLMPRGIDTKGQQQQPTLISQEVVDDVKSRADDVNSLKNTTGSTVTADEVRPENKSTVAIPIAVDQQPTVICEEGAATIGSPLTVTFVHDADVNPMEIANRDVKVTESSIVEKKDFLQVKLAAEKASATTTATTTGTTVLGMNGSTGTKNEGEWMDGSSSCRLSNKKRRKQMKIAKRAAAMATAMQKLASSTPEHNVSIPTGLISNNNRCCGGKQQQVTPIFSMGNTVLGM